jgi:ceramide glucosyltransferase
LAVDHALACLQGCECCSLSQMSPIFIRIIQIVSTAAALAGAGYYLACLWSAWSYLRDARLRLHEHATLSVNLPPVSILKPLKGVDPEIYDSFRSHCDQDYPADYEIIFGVSEADDPAVQVVKRLQQEFPQKQIQLVVCSERLGVNVKVSNLVQMLRAARYGCLIVNDSDIRVDSDYLRRVVSPLNDPDVGVVTCLYRGITGATFGSCLESLGISTDFVAGVLVARLMEGGIHFGLGSTLAFWRSGLQAIGGFESLVDYLADDYELGKRIGELGRRILLSEVVVATFLPPYTLKQFFQHQLRWARSIRDSRKGGYIGLLLTFGLPWAIVSALTQYDAIWPWALFIAVIVLRVAVALVVGLKVLGDRQVLSWLFLLPIRDFTAVVVWVASFGGNTINWRGDSFTLRDGKLIQRA